MVRFVNFLLKFTKKVLNIRKATIYLYHQNETKFNFLLIMKNTNHTTAKFLLGLSFLGLIYLLNILLFLIDLI